MPYLGIFWKFHIFVLTRLLRFFIACLFGENLLFEETLMKFSIDLATPLKSFLHVY